MEKTVVLYQSKYGAARRYARWIGERLGCEVLESKGISVAALQSYQTIIAGGGIYAGGVAGISLLQKNLERLKGKRLVLFAVGASPYDEAAVEEIKKRVRLPGAPLFYLRGAWDEDKMNFRDKALCALLKKMVAKQDPASLEPWQAAMAESLGKKCDWTDVKNLEPLFKFLAG